MNLSVLEHELELLPPEQLDRVSAFLTSLRMRRDGTMKEITRLLDDKAEENWISWDSVKSSLFEDSDTEG